MDDDSQKIRCCPYCGSEKLTRIDWGFADWECETCRNNFRQPAYKDENGPAIKTVGSSGQKSRWSNLDDKISKFCILLFFVFCVVVVLLFFFDRLHQIIIQFLTYFN